EIGGKAGSIGGLTAGSPFVSPSPPPPDDGQSPLRRLLPLVNARKWEFWGGMFLICIGRVFEAQVPLLVRDGIDRITAHSLDLLYPIGGILALAVLRYTVVAYGRQLVRLVGVKITYDMRERLYAHFQLQGP